MKDLKYYEEKQKNLLENTIKLDLLRGPVPITVDCTIETEEDLEKSSVQFALRRTWRRAAQVDFEKSHVPEMRFIKPMPGSLLNGIPLDEGIILPIFAADMLEDSEITTAMMIEGLILHLKHEFDTYYYRLLISFDLSVLPEQIQEKIQEWGGRLMIKGEIKKLKDIADSGTIITVSGIVNEIEYDVIEGGKEKLNRGSLFLLSGTKAIEVDVIVEVWGSPGISKSDTNQRRLVSLPIRETFQAKISHIKVSRVNGLDFISRLWVSVVSDYSEKIQEKTENA